MTGQSMLTQGVVIVNVTRQCRRVEWLTVDHVHGHGRGVFARASSTTPACACIYVIIVCCCCDCC